MDVEQYLRQSRINVIVKPNSSESKVISFDEDRQALRIDLKAKAEDNHANIELVKHLSKLTGKPARIIAGRTSKRKIISLG